MQINYYKTLVFFFFSQLLIVNIYNYSTQLNFYPDQEKNYRFVA